MDFNGRGGQQQTAATQQKPSSAKKQRGKGMRLLSGVLLVAIALLIAAIPVFIVTSDGGSQSKYLDKDKYQAVFLNGGQVYFGKIDNINDEFLTLDNIYYLRVNEQVQPETEDDEAGAQQDISLAKLGCELHGPEDLMVINAEQVSFWENLKDDGQVAKAINEFIKQNPDGQTCAEPSSDQ